MTGVDVFIFAAVGVGICFAAYNFAVIQRTKVNPGRTYQPANSPLIAVQAELAKVEVQYVYYLDVSSVDTKLLEAAAERPKAASTKLKADRAAAATQGGW